MDQTMEQAATILQKGSQKDHTLAAKVIDNNALPDEYMSRNEVHNCVDRLCKKYDRAFQELAK